MKDRQRVIIESPFAGDVERNKIYLHECLVESVFHRGEAPFASHALYPGVLRDEYEGERALGIHLGFLWGEHAHHVIFCVDLGWSKGMLEALDYWRGSGKPVYERALGLPWSELPPIAMGTVSR